MNTKALLGSAAAVLAAAWAEPRTEMLVSADWLAQHLNDPKVVVLHVARERAHYDAGHIPGACFVPWGELTASREGITNELPPADALEALFERCGVSDDTRVVLYGDFLLLSATRAWFTLDYLGHGGHAALLDGGLEAWKAGKHPLTTEVPPTKRGKLTPKPRPEAVATLAEVRELSRAAVGTGPLLLDSRQATDFTAAHIPGSVNVFWPQAIVSRELPTMKPASEVGRLYQAAGVAPGRTVVTYCNSGVQATHAYFTLKYLGYNVRLFDGSMQEWNSANTPTGK